MRVCKYGFHEVCAQREGREMVSYARSLQFDLGSIAAYCGGNVQVQSSLAWLWVGQSICG